jgi:hypothetical protein
MIFVNKGDAPITEAQLHKRTQAYIDRDWPAWKRERSLRVGDGVFNIFMDQVALDTDINRDNNAFNGMIVDYNKAQARLAQYVLLEGREEVREQVPTGEQVFDEETGEMVDVTEEVVVQTAIDPLPEFVEVTNYDEQGNATTETVRNPEVVRDEEERMAAQLVVDNTPPAVVEFVEAQ